MIIYKTTNMVNGKIYVGKDCNNNQKYFGSGLIIKAAIKKYGKNNFKKETLEVCDGDNWAEREIYWIKKLNARSGNIGYNIHIGGQGTEGGKNSPNFGKHSSKKTRQKKSKAVSGENNPMFGKHHSVEAKQKMAEARTGCKHSRKTRIKLSKIQKGEKGYWFGKQHSEKTKRKISESRKGKCVGDQNYMFGKHLSKKTRLLLSKAHTGKKHAEETKLKIANWSKRKDL